MKMFRTTAFVVSCFLLNLPVQSAASEQPVVPVGSSSKQPAVPAGVVKQALSSAQGTKSSKEDSSSIKAVKSSYKPFVIDVNPGINQVIPIALGHYNRIVTPFETPFINTVSEATIDVHKNIIYVATNDKFPVTLFISPDVDDESMALSVTLAPRKIPPIEATLKLNEDAAANLPIRTKAKKWEESQPYVDVIVSAMRALALGDVPEGYAMSKIKNGDAYPTCLQRGMRYDFANGQYLRGHNFNIVIGTIENITRNPKEIDEFACIDGSIVSVSAWPHTILEPGMKSEMYVMMKTMSKPVITRKRASLIDREGE